MGVNRCVFVAGKRRISISVQVKSTGSSLTLQSLYVTPSANTLIKNPDSGYDGFNQCIVYGDSNLVSGNIKNRVSIFGVSGSLTQGYDIFSGANNSGTSQIYSFSVGVVVSSIVSIYIYTYY